LRPLMTNRDRLVLQDHFDPVECLS
jgi:hypothetical protein